MHERTEATGDEKSVQTPKLCVRRGENQAAVKRVAVVNYRIGGP